MSADGLFIAGGFSAFIVIWLVLAAVGFGGFVLGVIALIDVARTPLERFGPWWDNTRQVWLIGIAVSFALPFGPFITGIVWFASGRSGFHTTGVAGRPFWAGAPKPPPAWPPYWAPPPAGPAEPPR